MPPKKTSRPSQSSSAKPGSSKPRSGAPRSSGSRPPSPRPSASRSSAPRTAKSFPVKKQSGGKSGFTPEDGPKSNNTRRKVLLVFGVVGGLFLLLLTVIVGVLDAYGQKDRARHADAIVVLGASVRPDGQPGQGLRMRVLHAVRLYKKGYAPKIIMTGGVGDNPPSEAQASADLAVKNGVPREDIIQENKSTSTWENAANSAAICKKRQWKSVLVVSDPFHLWRAQRNFSRCGMKVSVSPVAAALWKSQPGRRLVWTAREAVLVVRDWCLRRV